MHRGDVCPMACDADEADQALRPRLDQCFERAARTERRRGAILGVSSLVALRPVPHEAHYAASKAAAARYLGCLAFEAARVGVRVKVLHVGYVATGFAERGGWFGMRAPAGDRGSSVQPEDVAEAAMRLLASGRTEALLGWKERAIALGDRIFPELYDRWLRLRGGST